MKVCSVCKCAKGFDEFSNSKATKDGRANRCRPCNREYLAAWRSRNPSAFGEWTARNKERRADYMADWAARNKRRRAEYMSDWLRQNSATVNARIATRMARKKRATPSWANQDAIRSVYALAAAMTESTGVRHEVDHFYPLQGKRVCGLHCEANLQILTKAENISKLNRMPEEWRGVRGQNGPTHD